MVSRREKMASTLATMRCCSGRGGREMHRFFILLVLIVGIVDPVLNLPKSIVLK